MAKVPALYMPMCSGIQQHSNYTSPSTKQVKTILSRHDKQGRAIQDRTKVWLNTYLECEIYLHKTKMIHHKSLFCFEI